MVLPLKKRMAVERLVQTLLDSVADAGFTDGWSVLNRNVKVQIQHSLLDPEGMPGQNSPD